MKVSHPFHNLAALSGKMNEEKRMQLLQVEKNELDTQTQQLREQLNQKGDEVERLNSRVMELEHETSQSRILKAKVDELMSKNFQKDQTTKEKEENMFNLKREVESLRSDIRNMKHIESTLKAEIEDLLGKRKSLDEVNQNLKNQICE
jgi:chromosome segregation ATPase